MATVQQKLTTQDKLHRFGIHGPNRCSLCLRNNEDHKYICSQCLLRHVTRPDLIPFVLKKIKRKRKRFIFWNIYFKVWIFFYVVKKYIPISYLEYPVFDATVANIHIYQNLFSCVLHTANTLTCFERSFFYIKKYIGSFRKCVFTWIS